MFYLMVANSFDIPKQWSSGLGEKHYQYDADGGSAAQPPHSDTIKKEATIYTSQLASILFLFNHENSRLRVHPHYASRYH